MIKTSQDSRYSVAMRVLDRKAVAHKFGHFRIAQQFASNLQKHLQDPKQLSREVSCLMGMGEFLTIAQCLTIAQSPCQKSVAGILVASEICGRNHSDVVGRAEKTEENSAPV